MAAPLVALSLSLSLWTILEAVSWARMAKRGSLKKERTRLRRYLARSINTAASQ
jgi:hypothetical protein